MNYFHILPELLYVVIYGSSFPLLGDIEENTRKTIASLMMTCFISILAIEFAFVIFENLRGVYRFSKMSYSWAKDTFSKKKD